MIFRLSAVRFNSHRIHYDRDYATKQEGYPGLVVPVTLVTFLMMEMCRAEAPDRPLASFSYRSEKPVFDLGPYSLFGAPEGDAVTLWATDYENDLAVTASAQAGDRSGKRNSRLHNTSENTASKKAQARSARWASAYSPT